MVNRIKMDLIECIFFFARKKVLMGYMEWNSSSILTKMSVLLNNQHQG